MTQWQPIETAPKDGTHFLAYDGEYIQVCKFMKTGMLAMVWDGEPFSTDENTDCDATHWMPLPEPPE